MRRPIILFLMSFSTILLQAQNALHFDGTNDKVDCGNPTALQITGTAITIEAWIYANSWKTNVYEGGIVVKEQNSSNNGFMFRAGASGRLNFAFSGSGLPWKELTSAANTLSLNTWQHVAATYDGSKSRLYVNGIKVDSASYTGSIGNSANNLTIGGWYSTGRNFHGKIDEVRIWNVTRTGAEIAASMNGEFCGQISGLVAYYKFNQGTAGGTNTGLTTATDAAGSNNGTLQNFSLSGTTSNWVAGKALSTPTGGTGTDTVLACDSYTSPSGNHVWTQSGNYIDTILSPLGCDSIVNINLTVNDNTSGTITATACNKYVSPSGNYTWNQNGTYHDTIPNSQGCDSVLTIQLTMDFIDTNILVGAVSLTSWQANALYQWLDCDNGFAPIAGANNQSFFPAVSGTYAVEINKDGCIDTSGCYTLTGIGWNEWNTHQITISPNPTSDFITIDMANFNEKLQLNIYDITGKIQVQQSVTSAKTTIPIDLPAGTYFIELRNNKGVTNRKLIVQ